MSRGEVCVIIGTKTSVKSLGKSSRKRKNKNNKKSKVANNSTSNKTTGTSEVDEKKMSSEQPVQDQEDCIEIEATKKMCSIEFMIGQSKLPITQTEQECLKDFEVLRIINPNTDIIPYAKQTPSSGIDVNLRPCYNKNTRFYNIESSRATDRTDIFTKNINLFANNTQHTGSLTYGFSGEREQNRNYDHTNFNVNNRTSVENRSDFYRRPRNSERHYNNSRSYNSNNDGSRNNEGFNNSDNGLQTYNKPEHESNDSNPKKRTVIHYSLASKSNVVQLNTCENAWIPSCRETQTSTKTDEVQIEEIQKKVRSILNKITPETMTVLTKSILQMEITTYNCLSKIIDLLFQKAIDEPNFTPQYAYICSQMRDIGVISEDGKTKTYFRQLIVLKCQETFELISSVEKNAVKSLLKIKSCKDQALKKEMQFNYDESERIQRKRSVGNCRFMCELFKVKLLNSNILQMCVTHLLKLPKEEPLECLCNILKHIGKHLNPEKTFEKLQEFTSKSYKTKISSRIRFMIQDTIDLKNNNWVPRNAVVKPKTLNEIQEEFTMVPTNNRVFSECSLPAERPLKNYLNSNAQKVNTESFNIQKKSESCPNSLQDNMRARNVVYSNFEKREVENSLPADNSEVELNTCKNAWVPRFRISQKPIANSEVKIENKINEEKTTGSNPEKKNIEPDLPTENSKVELNTSKNPWTPRWFRTSPKLTGMNKVEMKEIDKNVQEDIQINTNNEQNEMNEEKTIRSNPETDCIQPDSPTKNNIIELSTSKNPWVPLWCRNAPKWSRTNKVVIKEIEIKEQELPKPNTPINIAADNEQDSCKTFESVVFSMTQENIVLSTNKLIPRISSVDLVEEMIDVLFERATSEPSSIPLLVEICFLLKGIVLSVDKGALHVSFKKQLAARCQKLLQTGISIISKETYTMIGELFNNKLAPLNILVDLIKDIPNQLTDASIGNICFLLKIIGAEIERPYSLKPTIMILEAYVKNDTEGLISLKHKDEVMDLLKLRNNKWIPVKSIDPLPTTTSKNQNVSESHLEKLLTIPEERKRGKHRRKKHRYT